MLVIYSNNANSIVIKDRNIIETKEIYIECVQIAEGNYVIRNLEEYTEVIKINPAFPNCNGYHPPVIDFDKNTLIGVRTSTGGCSAPRIEYLLFNDSISPNYKFQLITTKNGICRLNFPVMVWCLIPKIDNSIKLLFEVIEN